MDLDQVARQVAAILDPDALLGPSAVGGLLDCNPRYVTEHYALLPSFPTAIRLPGKDGRRSHPKYQRKDIVAWIESNKSGKSSAGGRPRQR